MAAKSIMYPVEVTNHLLTIPVISSDNFDVMAMIAIDRRGPKDNLPTQLQEREQPNDRKPLTEIVMEGQFRISNSG